MKKRFNKLFENECCSTEELEQQFEKLKSGEISLDQFKQTINGSSDDHDLEDEFDDHDLEDEFDDHDLEDEFDQDEKGSSRGHKDVEYEDTNDEEDEQRSAKEEKWIHKVKPKFEKQYGKKRGMNVLYATANKKKKTGEFENEEEFDEEDQPPKLKSVPKVEKNKKQPAKKVDSDPNKSDSKSTKKGGNEDNLTNRGRGKPISERGGSLREWMKANPHASRKEFMEKAKSEGLGTDHANTLYYSIKRKTTECWFIQSNGKYLSENSSFAKPNFVKLNADTELLVFENKKAAYRMLDILNEKLSTPAFVVNN